MSRVFVAALVASLAVVVVGCPARCPPPSVHFGVAEGDFVVVPNTAMPDLSEHPSRQREDQTLRISKSERRVWLTYRTPTGELVEETYRFANAPPP